MGNPSQGAASENTVSAEELKICDDLQAEIEDDLEKEIISEICRLTRHLQRLYQHKDRRELARSTTHYHFSLSNAEDGVLSGINIRLTLDGQCKIDIAKVEQDDAVIQSKSSPRIYVARVEQDDADIQSKSSPKSDQSKKRQGSMKIRHTETVSCRKPQKHPVEPWR